MVYQIIDQLSRQVTSMYTISHCSVSPRAQSSLVPSRTTLALCAKVRLVSESNFLALTPLAIRNVRWPTRSKDDDINALSYFYKPFVLTGQARELLRLGIGREALWILLTTITRDLIYRREAQGSGLCYNWL